MKLLLFILALFMSGANGFAQKLKISVVDSDENPLENVLILDNNKVKIAETNGDGVVFINKSKDIIGLSKQGYADRWLKISGSDQKEVTIIMDYYYHEFDAVTVQQSKSEEALSIDAVNIIDYFPFGESILTLKRFKGTYYVGVDSIGVEGIRHEFSFDRPKRLFMDCLGNMHVICSERVYQIAFTNDELIIIDDISKDIFNILLEPCVAQFGDKYVMKSLTYGNQAYSLALYNKLEDPKMFLLPD